MRIMPLTQCKNTMLAKNRFLMAIYSGSSSPVQESIRSIDGNIW